MMQDRERSLANASTMSGIGQVIARTAVELHPIAGFASNNPEAIVLNLVEPCLARGRSWGSRWEARPNETCRIKKL